MSPPVLEPVRHLRPRGGGPGVLATSVLLLALLLGGTLSAWTQGSGNSPNVFESAATYPPPTANDPPAIAGIEQDGELLTSTDGGWGGPGGPFSFAYQWLRCDADGLVCDEVSGATGQTYALTPDDVRPEGFTMRIRVTATNLYGQASADSAATGVIQARTPANTSEPTITGTPRENQWLSADPGTWTGTEPLEYSHQWSRCDSVGDTCVEITGAVGSSYQVGHDDEGSTIRVTVTASNAALPGGDEESATSAPTGVSTAISESAKSRYATNGSVFSMTRSGGDTYLGGSFSLVGKPTGAFAEVGLSDAVAEMDLPPVSGGFVKAVEPDGSGGWYIGGSFTRIGDVLRSRIAHVLPDGSVDPGWNPGANDIVGTIAATASTIYVGGHFSLIGGALRNRVAALNPATGVPTGWNPNAQPGTDGLSQVYSILPNGSTVYVSGEFETMGGLTRPHVAEVSTATGAPTSFNPSPNAGVFTMQKAGSILYLGGSFTSFGGIARLGGAAIDTTTGLLTGWNPSLSGGSTLQMLLSGSTMFIGGLFTTVGGVSHPGLVGVNTTTGAVTWNPPDPAAPVGTEGAAVWALELFGTTLYAGGDFRTVGGQSRRNIAAFSTSTGQLTTWAPQAGGPILEIEISGDDVYMGGFGLGSVMLMNVVPRSNAAAFDSEGAPTQWNPNISGAVRALSAAGSKLYMGGEFTSVGGQPRDRLAAVSLETGAVDSWNPGANGTVHTMAINGARLYAGGEFTTVGGQARTRLAAIDATGAVIGNWAPTANAVVRALHPTAAGKVYLGGDFTAVNSQGRNRLAAVDTSTGAVLSWNPDANSTVRALYGLPDETMYVGGDFTTVGGQPRNRLAGVDGTGATLSWNPGANGPVHALSGLGQAIWAGGEFTALGGVPRTNLAGLRLTSDAASNWNPAPEGVVRAVLSDGSGIHAGGDFALMGTQAPQSYAHFE